MPAIMTRNPIAVPVRVVLPLFTDTELKFFNSSNVSDLITEVTTVYSFLSAHDLSVYHHSVLLAASDALHPNEVYHLLPSKIKIDKHPAYIASLKHAVDTYGTAFAQPQVTILKRTLDGEFHAQGRFDAKEAGLFEWDGKTVVIKLPGMERGIEMPHIGAIKAHEGAPVAVVPDGLGGFGYRGGRGGKMGHRRGWKNWPS